MTIDAGGRKICAAACVWQNIEQLLSWLCLVCVLCVFFIYNKLCVVLLLLLVVEVSSLQRVIKKIYIKYIYFWNSNVVQFSSVCATNIIHFEIRLDDDDDDDDTQSDDRSDSLVELQYCMHCNNSVKSKSL